MTIHRPPARPSAPQENQCSISHFLASLGAQEDWYCTHIAHQCCDQLTAVRTGYPLTSITWPYHGLRCWPTEVEYLFDVIRWQLLVFKWSQAQAKIQPVFTGMPVAFSLFSPRLRVGHALRPIFMLWLVKIWQVSSCGKCMQHLETCLLWQLKLTEFCVNLRCF